MPRGSEMHGHANLDGRMKNKKIAGQGNDRHAIPNYETGSKKGKNELRQEGPRRLSRPGLRANSCDTSSSELHAIAKVKVFTEEKGLQCQRRFSRAAGHTT